jgi:hypothetical protein
MKQLIATLFVLTIHLTSAGQVGINNNNAVPAPSSMLDVSSANKGVLIPRMTTAQRKAIVTPAVGLLVFDVEKFSLYMFDGQTWMALSAKEMRICFPSQGCQTILLTTKHLEIMLAYRATMQLLAHRVTVLQGSLCFLKPGQLGNASKVDCR